MKKIQTDRQVKGELLIVWSVMSAVCGVAISYAAGACGADMLMLSWLTWCILCIMPLVTSGVVWALRNQIDRGLKYMWKHYLLVLSLRKQLLDAGLYVTRRIGASEVAIIPEISVKFLPDYVSGRIYIKNSIKLHGKLSKTDISAAIGRYVVEQIYLSDNSNYYYFDFYDSSINRRLVFKTFEMFKRYSDALGKYELFVDTRTRLPLTHHLIVGQTGSGKTYALHGLLMQMIMKPVDYQLYFCDPKGSSIALLGERISPENTADNFDDIIALLENFVSEMGKRQQEIKERLKYKIDGDYTDFDLSPHILIFDEYAAFSLQLQAKEKKQRDHVNDLISQVVLKGRQSGFFLWIVMQQAGSNNIPTFLRDNLPWKTVLGNAEDQTYVTAFGAGVDIPERKMKIGEGVYTYPAVAEKPKLCAFPTLNFDILDALTRGAGVL